MDFLRITAITTDMNLSPQLDPVGVVADAIGGDTSSAIALMSAIFNGILSPGPTEGVGNRDSVMEDLQFFHLAIVDDDGSAAAVVRWLLRPIRSFQQECESRFRDVHPEGLKQFLLSKKPAIRQKLEDRLPIGHQDLRDVLGFDPKARLRRTRVGRSRLLRLADAVGLIPSELIPQLDFLLHPRVLLEEPPLGRAKRAISDLHGGRVLVYGGRSLPYSCRRSHSGRKLFASLASASSFRGWTYAGVHEASMIFHAESADWRDPQVPYDMVHVLLLRPPRERGFVGSLSGRDLPRAWTNALGKELVARPRAQPLRGWVDEDEKEQSSFKRAFGTYKRECKGLKACGSVVRALPILIYRMLRAVYGSDAETGVKPPLIRMAFRHARILRKRHVDLWPRLAHGRILEERGNLPNRILKEIRDMQPMWRREVFRRLNPQQTSQLLLISTTLDWLLHEGLIVKDEEGDYLMGAGCDLEASLRRLRESVQDPEVHERPLV